MIRFIHPTSLLQIDLALHQDPCKHAVRSCKDKLEQQEHQQDDFPDDHRIHLRNGGVVQIRESKQQRRAQELLHYAKAELCADRQQDLMLSGELAHRKGSVNLQYPAN